VFDAMGVFWGLKRLNYFKTNTPHPPPAASTSPTKGEVKAEII
jgi:hypothetical protein